MKNFATDLWNDLRAKRLWPVAVLLLAGLVAVPILLSKGAEEPPPAPARAADSARNAPDPAEFDGLASVELEESLPSEGSSLDTFDPSDPFRPPQGIVDKAEQDDLGVAAGGPSAITATVGGGSAGSGGSGDPGGGTGSTPDTGSPADPGTGDDGGSDNEGGNGNGGGTTTTEYTWVIDVTFTENGRTRKIKGLQRLDLLPSVASPLLLFLGASVDADDAVFLVDAKLEAAGEGKCKPSASECGFLYLGAGSEHMFTNADGDSYRLRVDQIRKVKLVEAETKRPKAARNASGARRRFTSPLISDLVSMSTTTVDSSKRGGDRR